MDTIIDKLAQKLSANDMIRANSAAEAKEIKYLREKVESYEKLLHEMKIANMKNIEAAEKSLAAAEQLKEAVAMNADVAKKNSEIAEKSELAAGRVLESVEKVAESADKVKESANWNDSIVKKNAATAVQLSDLIDGGITVVVPKEENEPNIEELFKKTNSNIHTENVMVYRNVQAVVNDGLRDQTDEIVAATDKNNKKQTLFVKVMSVAIFVAVVADVVINVLQFLGVH